MSNEYRKRVLFRGEEALEILVSDFSSALDELEEFNKYIKKLEEYIENLIRQKDTLAEIIDDLEDKNRFLSSLNQEYLTELYENGIR